MMDPIIECVANCSEGRKESVIEALAQAITRVPEVRLFDIHRDVDHHRSVFTFAGPPERVAEAAFQLVKTSVSLINMCDHAGQHPRIGATDVLPFVPLKNATMEQCIKLAKQVGKRIGEELDIPVFLYEEACQYPARKQLEWIRRGGLEGLKRRMAHDPNWAPDFGPSQVHPTAGAIAVGARSFLIAFNIVLGTHDLAVAKAIAKKIRASDGGLPAVKALGIELKTQGLVQVSINLTNYRQTSVHEVFEAVKTEAERLGVSVVNSELVGLIPQDAVTAAASYFLKCENLKSDRIVESCLWPFQIKP